MSGTRTVKRATRERRNGKRVEKTRRSLTYKAAVRAELLVVSVTQVEPVGKDTFSRPEVSRLSCGEKKLVAARVCAQIPHVYQIFCKTGVRVESRNNTSVSEDLTSYSRTPRAYNDR